MGSADDSSDGVMALERFVRLHIKALYDFLRALYPAVDPNEYIDATFETTHLVRLLEPQQTCRLMLFAECRRQVLGNRHVGWMSRNLSLVRQQINDQSRQLSTDEARDDLVRVTTALSTLGSADQEVLLIASTLRDCSDDDLAIVLACTAETATERLTGARAAMEHAYKTAAQTELRRGERQ